MFEYSLGNFVLSSNGHDKNEIFIILKSDFEYIYLLDGISRTLDNPKKKNKKHVQPIDYVDENLQNKIVNHKSLINEDIKRAIKVYKKQIQL